MPSNALEAYRNHSNRIKFEPWYKNPSTWHSREREREKVATINEYENGRKTDYACGNVFIIYSSTEVINLNGTGITYNAITRI